MKADITTAAGKTIGAAVLTAFNLTWPALIAALVCASFSFHFNKEQMPKTFLGICYAIGAMASAGLVATKILPKVPGFAWTATVDDWALAGAVSLVANLVYLWLKKWMATKAPAGG